MKESKNKHKGAIFIPAGLFLGFGVGFLLDNLPGWMFMGMGVGFAAYTISLFFEK